MAEEFQGQMKNLARFQTKCTGVPGTNDSSSVSKHSVVQQGYFKDQYIHHFISKKSRRSPLINLGYYVRMVVIENVLLEFIKSMQNSACQILSLGAGFDTSFFRLSDLQEYKDFTFFEIDLPEVVERKASIILSCDELISKLKIVKVGELVDSNDCGLWSENYRLLAADLRDLSVVKIRLQNYELDFNKPTLILSECSITYMDEISSRALIKFSEELLHNAIFVTYEQICPDDAFGMVMINHFKVINSPLLSVSSYPLLKDQERRFLHCGWQNCCAVSVWEAFINSTTEEERSFILRLEPFDEWEEWHLKCNHYTLVIAAKGCLVNWIPFSNFRDVSPLDSIVNPKPLNVEIHELYKINEVFGQCSLIHSNKDEYIVNIGGFGRLGNGSHGRLKDVTCFKIGSSFNEIETRSVDNAVFDFVHHSCTILNDTESNQEMKFILYGGRQSPLSCVNCIPKLVHCKFNDVMLIETSYLGVESSSHPVPEPRWRHSACILDVNSIKLFLVFGGCSSNFKVFDDFWSINLNRISNEMTWQRLDLPMSPCGRFSHSVSVYADRMYLSGGLNEKSKALSDLWVYEAGEMWMELPVYGIIPRYGHTSHIYTWNDLSLYMILIGGVSTHRETWPGIAVIDLVNFTCIEYSFPCVEPAKSIMLQNHSTLIRKDKKSLFIVGGGGNCFSFGTKFNSYIAEVPLLQLFDTL